MDKYEFTLADRIALLFCLAISVVGVVFLFTQMLDQYKRISSLEQQLSDCSCNVSYGGHNMSVEDAPERAGEGLTVDQWQEVQVMIDNALNESAGR